MLIIMSKKQYTSYVHSVLLFVSASRNIK